MKISNSLQSQINDLKKLFLNKKISLDKVPAKLYSFYYNFFIETNLKLDKSSDFALLTTGSFSRKELCFYSDLDILFIIEDKKTEKELNQIIENFIYPLWNLKLQIGYSVRTIEEFIDFATNDVIEWTKILDCRFLLGNKTIYEKFIKITNKKLFSKNMIHKNLKEFFILNDDRREKFGKLIYNLEPDIKNNPGSLRDINLIFWYLKLFKENNFLNKQDLIRIKNANNFFINIRNISHLLNNKKYDLLNFDNQDNISNYLYPRKSSAEYLMKKFYFHAEFVDYIYEYLRENFFSTFLIDSSLNKKIDNNFYIENFKLFMYNYKKLSQNLYLVLRAFYLSQKFKVFLSYDLRRNIKSNVKKIKTDFIRNQKNINLFFNILEHGQGLASTLRLMNQLNFLQYFIPEFKKIKYKITYDSYHQFTVDIHNLLTVQELRNLFSGAYILEFPFISALSLNIPNKKYLLLSGLIHDIGKGFKGPESHLIKGEKISQRICSRMNISKKNTNIINFLVRNHTLMTNFALRRDIKNEEEIFNFAKLVGTVEKLNFLFLLSFADLKAVSPDSFDKLKYNLLQELYIKAFSVIRHKRFETETIQEKIAQIKSYILEHIPKKDEIEFNKFISKLSRRLILNFTEEEILAIYNLTKENNNYPFIDITYNKETDTFKIFIIFYNYQSIFNKLLGILSLNNLNILSAEIYSNLDGTIIDIFEVKPIFYDNYAEEKIPHYKEEIMKHLTSKTDEKEFHKIVENKIFKHTSLKKVYNIIPIIKFNNEENEFFTILEIVAKDFAGLLYILTRVLSKRNIEIHSSKITTQGIKAIDTFYITDLNGNKIIDKQLQKSITKEIMEIIEEFS